KSFDPEIFLATVNHGRALSEFRTGRVVFSQGDAADSVFCTPSHRGSAKVVAWRGILDSSSGDDSGRLSVGERTGGPDCAGAEWFGGASGRASGQCDLVAGQGLELREGRRGPFARR